MRPGRLPRNCGALSAGPAFAQQPADAIAKFYQGRQIFLVCYSEAGSAYDVYARLLGRHMGRFIPGNPTSVKSRTISGCSSRTRRAATASPASNTP